MNKGFLLLSGLISIQFSFAQQKQAILDYINRYKGIAMEEMVRSGIPASITLAQGIHESNYGQSPLSREANNHFGIKCKEQWTGKKYIMDDDERDECFRVYEHAEASYADHSDFLISRPRYADLFKLPITDYKGWAHGLKAAGYATNPKYANILIGEIEEYGLAEFDREGLALIKEKGRPSSYTYAESASASKDPVAPVPVAPKKEPETAVAFGGSVENESPEKINENGRKEHAVNGLRALVAYANEDPLKIAMDYELEFSQVMQYNDLTTGERFREGEYIFLQQKKSKCAEKTHEVMRGESMRDVAQKFGIRMHDLYAKNLMKPYDQVRPGETLNLRDKRKSPPKTITYAQFLKLQREEVRPAVTQKKPANSSGEYKVQPSDTLFSIARKFNMSVDELKALNNLDSVIIREGQRLVVSK